MKTSCLLSCYKNENSLFLKQSLESIQKQTYKVDEIILVEDGPLTQELYNVLDSFKNKIPLKRIKLNKNIGLAGALNVGLENSIGDVIFRMDTDDICEPQRFQKQIEVFEKNKDLDIVGCWANDIDHLGGFLKIRKVPVEDDRIKKLIWANPIIHPGVSFRKSSIVRIGSYDQTLRKRQDYELWFRAVKYGLKFYNVPEPLLNYRFTDNYYEKNSSKVAWAHTKVGFKGLLSIKSISVMSYIGVVVPLFRSLLPDFLSKRFHKLMNLVDPRKKD